MKRHQHRYDDDPDYILKDGERLRVPLTMMDSMDPVQKAVAQSSPRSSVQVTDGQGGTLGLHRPGWRLPVIDPVLCACDAARRDYETVLVNAYRTPVGFGDPDNGADSPGPRHQLDPGRVDHRTVAQMMCDRQNKTADIYDKLDHELSERWR